MFDDLFNRPIKFSTTAELIDLLMIRAVIIVFKTLHREMFLTFQTALD